MKALWFALAFLMGLPLCNPHRADGSPPLRFAISAMISPKETFSAYLDFADYLSSRLKRPILLKQRRTYQEVNQLLGSGEIDFAWLCTGGFAEAQRDIGAVALVAPVFQGAPRYHAYVIVPRDSPAERFRELRGRVFAFTDPLSLTGRFYPTYLVMKEGESVDRFFADSFYTYSHDRSIEAVAHGLAGGASVDSLVFEYLLAIKRDLVARTRIIHVSPPFGSPPIAASPHLDPEWAERIKRTILRMSLDPEGRATLQRLNTEGFVAPSSDLYDEARKVWEAARSWASRSKRYMHAAEKTPAPRPLVP